MYQIPSFKNFKGLFHAFSTVDDGNMSLVINHKNVNPNEVIKNRKIFFGKIGVDIKCAMTIWLEHSDKVVKAREEWLGKTILNETDPPKADAVITDKKNCFLVLTIADCVPVIIYDQIKKVIGLIHAGWRGVDKKIVTKTIQELGKKYNSNLKDLIIGIGPCIGKDSYVKDNFPKDRRKAWGGFIEDVECGKYSIDLLGYVKEQLLNSGVKDTNIYRSGIDVFKNKNFYSHYRDVRTEKGDSGRFICVVGIVN